MLDVETWQATSLRRDMSRLYIDPSRTRKTGNREKGRTEDHGGTEDHSTAERKVSQGDRSGAGQGGGLDQSHGGAPASQNPGEPGRGAGHPQHQTRRPPGPP